MRKTIRDPSGYTTIQITSGKYFNKGVKALDSTDIGHVVRETPDKIIVFGVDIQQVGANVLIGLTLKNIVNKYKVSREDPLPTSRKDPWT